MSNLVQSRRSPKWRNPNTNEYWPSPQTGYQDRRNQARRPQLDYDSDAESNSINAPEQSASYDSGEDDNLIDAQPEPPTDQSSAEAAAAAAADQQWSLAENSIKPPKRQTVPTGGPSTAAKVASYSEQRAQPVARQSSRLREHNATATNTIARPISRLTMLEDPSAPKRADGRAQQQNNSSLSSGPSEKQQLHTWPEGPQMPSSRLHAASSTLLAAPTSTHDHLRQPAEQYLLFIPSVSAILLLLGLILHIAYRRRAKTGTPGCAAARLLPPLLVPSCCLRRSGARKRLPTLTATGKEEDDEDQAEVAFLGPAAASAGSLAAHHRSAQNYGCGGERIRLVERKSLVAQQQQAAPNAGAIFAEAACDDADIIRLDPANDCAEGGPAEESRTSTIVILQRRLAKNSLVVAAKSTKPKVRLITARVRRFIDDEADELRNAAAKSGADRPLKARLLACLSTILGGAERREPEVPEAQNCANSDDRVAATGEHPAASTPLQQSSAAAAADRAKMEDELDTTCTGTSDKIGLCQNSREEDLREQQPVAGIGLAAMHVGQTKLLSPSPVLNEACSSISACSLFTPIESPIEAAQICDCSINAASQLAVGAAASAAAAAQGSGLGVELGGGELRSKSQGHSPSGQLNQVGAAANNYRPCCSVSPSALVNAQLEPVGERAAFYHHHQHPPPAHSCHHHPQQQFHIDHKLKLLSQLQLGDQHARRSTFGAGAGEPLVSPGQLKNIHLKRQYENYYEDEQEDAYRRLTASIGMHFEHPQQIGGYADAATKMDTHLFRYGCHQQQQRLQEHPTGAPYLASHMIQTATTANLAPHGQLFPPSLTRPLCKCCQPPDHAGQNLDELRLCQNSCPEQRTLDHQFAFAGQWNAGGSISELPSSTSTSLGGSDSGFISGANNYNGLCHNPLCSCQRQVLNLAAPPPMSILVQQSSFATPPPQQEQLLTSDAAAAYMPSLQPNSTDLVLKPAADCAHGAIAIGYAQTQADCNPMAKETTTQVAIDEGSKRCRPLPQALSKTTCSHRAKWRHRRRGASYRRTPVDQSSAAQASPGVLSPRRMSTVASCELGSPTGGADFTCISQATQQLSSHHAQQHAALLHRASIASDGGSVRSQWAHQARHFSPLHHPPSQLPDLDQFQIGPNDAAFFDQFASVSGLNSKSNCGSSSGGSSSGIGFSGSTCTNTPTSAFACDNLPISGRHPNEPLIDFCLLSRGEHQMAAARRHNGFQQQSARTNPLVAERGRLHEQLGSSCSSRKFSLPVQLESQAADRVSPNRSSRLLFEKNLQRVDSTSQLQGRGQQLPGEAVPVRSQNNMASHQGSPCRQFDSRRNSQSITRQSSFWLEDNSADSILSLTTSGGLMESQQASIDDCAFADVFSAGGSGQARGQQREEANSERPPAISGQQRPSLGSLTQSGDSIESVKRKPTGPEDAAKVAAAPDADQPGGGGSPAPFGAKELASGRSQAGRGLRLSSSSTSSTASSPSPDFSKPSGRLLGLAARSSSIAKRHLSSKLRARRFSSRLSAASFERGNSSAANRRAYKSSLPKQRPLDESEEDDEDAKSEFSGIRFSGNNDQNLDGQFAATAAGTSSGGAGSEVSSASLERQCRELWKLRATLHEDSCVADNWTNYHQRLNRRYDSGYKSIENQLSTSLEGNLLAAAHPPAASSGSRRLPAGEPPARPQSVCSNAADCEAEAGPPASAGKSFDEQMQVSPSTEEEKSNEKSEAAPRQTSIESVESKLAEFDFDDSSTLVDEPIDRACESRNSKSSGEDDKPQEAPHTYTNQFH